MDPRPDAAAAGRVHPTRILVAWATRRGGTEGIARIIAESLAEDGFDVVVQPAHSVRDLDRFHAAIVGGALYANRWHHDARRFVERNVASLRRIPVWLFSSGPLDDSAEQQQIPPVTQVAVLMERIGACGHATFGGRLPADARGFPAAAMAKTQSGDRRNPERIRAWAGSLARDIPIAQPRIANEPAARSRLRWATHGLAGWALCAILMGGLSQLTSRDVAVAVHAGVAPLIFMAVAVHYFRAWGAREPLPTALAWTALVVALDAGLIAGVVLRDFAMFESFVGTWLPLGLIFLATWVTGMIVSMLPRSGRALRAPAA
jgi:menaquinone-dependent protoporphyrinogen oxidase